MTKDRLDRRFHVEELLAADDAEGEGGATDAVFPRWGHGCCPLTKHDGRRTTIPSRQP